MIFAILVILMISGCGQGTKSVYIVHKKKVEKILRNKENGLVKY